MPVYIVSWSDGECMLMRCRDEDDLIYRLDQFDDPSDATWQVYRGRFTISLRPMVDREGGDPYVRYSAELEGDEAAEVEDAISRFAFPMTYRAQKEAWREGEDVGLELLLRAEIESKGRSGESADKMQDWMRRTFESQLQDLPQEERDRRLEILAQLMGWK